MSTMNRSRRAAFGIAAVLACALVTPMAVAAENQNLAAAPAVPAWDETSGYGSVEATRAASAALLADRPARDAPRGYGAVDVSLAEARAMLAPSASTTQVSPDVRWAPAHVVVADLRGGQRGLRAADLAAARAWDETSGYGSVEASRAASSALVASPGTTHLAAPD